MFQSRSIRRAAALFRAPATTIAVCLAFRGPGDRQARTEATSTPLADSKCPRDPGTHRAAKRAILAEITAKNHDSPFHRRLVTGLNVGGKSNNIIIGCGFVSVATGKRRSPVALALRSDAVALAMTPEHKTVYYELAVQ